MLNSNVDPTHNAPLLYAYTVSGIGCMVTSILADGADLHPSADTHTTDHEPDSYAASVDGIVVLDVVLPNNGLLNVLALEPPGPIHS